MRGIGVAEAAQGNASGASYISAPAFLGSRLVSYVFITVQVFRRVRKRDVG